MSTPTRKRDHRLEVRTTAEERAIINQAVQVAGTDLTSFTLESVLDASRRILADRVAFTLSPEQALEWDRVNDAPARQLPGLLRLFERPSPFAP